MAIQCAHSSGSARSRPRRRTIGNTALDPANRSISPGVGAVIPVALGGFVLPVLYRAELGCYTHAVVSRIVSFPLFFSCQLAPGGGLYPQHQQIADGLHNAKPPRPTGTPQQRAVDTPHPRMSDASRTHRATGITPQTRRRKTANEIWLSMSPCGSMIRKGSLSENPCFSRAIGFASNRK